MNNNGHNGSKFVDGLMWGAIIGGAAVFLLGTKKGKRLLKTITEGGVEGLQDIMEQGMEGIEEEMDEDYEDQVADSANEGKDPSFAKASEGNGAVSNGVKEVKEKINQVKQAPRKRFFRRRNS